MGARTDQPLGAAPAAPPELRELVERGGDTRLRVPRAPEPGGAALFARVAAGSLGLTLVLGIALGLAMNGALGTPPPAVVLEGPGRLAPGEIEGRLRAARAGEAAAIRLDLLSSGMFTNVVAERGPFGGYRLMAVETRAVALLDGDPALTLAADGTVLGAATAEDLDWAGRPDLPVVRGAMSGAAPDPDRPRPAGALAAGLEDRPRLDRLVSEIHVDRGPLRLEAVLRPSGVEVLLTRERFLAGLEVVDELLPTPLARWPALRRIDARLPDRLFLDAHGTAEGNVLAGRDPAGGIER